mmetsp:Transcript_21892/g.64944  ORF Transcript_21892/g.64944 Transcript_21892/m.64944 type:complete len:253 (+) Transcript_21892:462-1220(+)
MDVDGGYASAEEDAGPASGWPAAASGSKKGPGCSHSGAGTSAAAEGSEGAVAGSAGCGGTRTPEAESGAREARAAVVAGGDGPVVSVDTSLRNPRRRRRRGRAAAFARCLFLVVPAYRPRPATNPHRSLRTLRRGSESGLILLLRGPRSMRWARQPTRRSRRRQRGRFRARRAAPSRTALPLLANLAPPTTRLPSGRLSRRLRRRHGTRRAALGLGRLWTLCRNRGRDVATEGRSYGLAPRRCRTRRGGRSW